MIKKIVAFHFILFSVLLILFQLINIYSFNSNSSQEEYITFINPDNKDYFFDDISFANLHSYDADGLNALGLDREEDDLIKFDFEVNGMEDIHNIGLNNIHLMRDSLDFVKNNAMGFNLLEKNCVFFNENETYFSKCFAKMNIEYKKYNGVIRCNTDRYCLFEELVFQDHIDLLSIKERNITAKTNFLNEIDDQFSNYNVLDSSCENNKFANSQRICKAKVEIDTKTKLVSAWCRTEGIGCVDLDVKELPIEEEEENVTYSCFEGYMFNNSQCVKIAERFE